MIRRAFVLASLSSLPLVAFVACSDDGERPDLTPEPGPDSSGVPDTWSPPVQDSGRDGSSFDAASEPVACTVTPCAVELAAGARHVCARMSDGDVRCWGDNATGAVGNGKPKPDGGKGDEGEPEDTTRPVRVTDLARVTQISAANATTCARRDDGAVLCWGANDSGQLGLTAAPASSDREAHAYASPVALGAAAARVDVGQRSACAVLSSGGLSCWGANDNKQLARLDKDLVLGPGAADLAGFTVTRSAGARTSTYALTTTGGLLSWGVPVARQGSLRPDPVPAPIPSLSGVHDWSVGPMHACAIANGGVYCWGSGLSHALCTGLPSDEAFPAHATMETTAYPQQISVSRSTTCARLTDGTIQCCGDSNLGQLAIVPPDGGGIRTTFTRAEKFVGHAVAVVTTDTATCALLRSGAVECWGGNAHGELGQGTQDADPHPTPQPVTFR